MAVCNIFNDLTKPTGTFLTFAQYMDDLTKCQVESIYYKIVPSKFIALDINPSGYNNTSLPQDLQLNYENACACFKTHPELFPNQKWSPEYSKVLFWDFMFDKKLISSNLNEIKYVGDINIQSYKEVDGIGYSDLYCHIPNNVIVKSYEYDCPASDTYTIVSGDALEGFKSTDNIGSGTANILKPITYSITKQDYKFDWDNAISLEEQPEYFNINTIIVLYDIWCDENVKISDVPMGIYFTGLIDDTGSITNKITIYTSNEEIYGSGTSYGLRICSRYITGPQDQYTSPIITTERDDNNELSQVLSQLSVSQNKMDKIINKVCEENQRYKELYGLFTSSKTNVPYIKSINGVDYWFVNGKKINPVNAATSNNQDGNNCSSYTDDELFAGLDSEEFLDLSTSLKLSTDEKLSVSDLDNTDVKLYSYGARQLLIDKTDSEGEDNLNNMKSAFINWSVQYNGEDIPSDKEYAISIAEKGGSVTNYNCRGGVDGYFQIPNFNPTGNKGSLNIYTIYAGYNGATSREVVRIQYVYPTYFGHSSLLYTEDSSDILSTIVGELTKVIIGSKKQSYIVPKSDLNGSGLKQLYLIYPKEFGELTSINDENNYNYFNDFTKYEVELNGVSYLLYVDEKGAVSVSDKIIYFK